MNDGNQSTVLIVDDEEMVTTALRNLFRLRTNYKTVVHTSPAEALANTNGDVFDLVVSDYMMPGMDGWEAARTLRANPETKDIPILAATALFRDSDLKGCLDAGCNGYIVKPFTFQELQGKVREFIASSNSDLPS